MLALRLYACKVLLRDVQLLFERTDPSHDRWSRVPIHEASLAKSEELAPVRLGPSTTLGTILTDSPVDLEGDD